MLICRDHGRLGSTGCFAPTDHYAEAGVPPSRPARVSTGRIINDKPLAPPHGPSYLNRSGPRRVGQRFVHNRPAEVAAPRGRRGRAAFYEGEVAEDMGRQLRALGGVHTLEDFAATACNYTTPVSGHYKGIELVEHPPERAARRDSS